MTAPLDIARRWTWTDGSDRTLPDWLTGHHHWHHDRPVIHTIDGPRTLYDGWIVAQWTDGAITVGSTTVADRVYGDNGLAGRLARAEAELAGVRALNERWVKAGPPLGQSISRWWDRRLAELGAALQPAAHNGTPPVHVGGRVNAEGCPACTVAAVPPPYPWICPGPA